MSGEELCAWPARSESAIYRLGAKQSSLRLRYATGRRARSGRLPAQAQTPETRKRELRQRDSNAPRPWNEGQHGDELRGWKTAMRRGRLRMAQGQLLDSNIKPR